MKELVEQFISIYGNYYSNGNKVEHCEYRWARFTIQDRFDIIREYPYISELITSHECVFDFDTSWTWQVINYDGMTFNNPRIKYCFFITPKTKSDQHEKTNNYINSISDTIDPLYDCSLFELASAIRKANKPCPSFSNFRRTEYGFNIIMFSQKSTLELYKTNPFRRDMELQRIDDREYLVKIYMTDKTPENIINTFFNKKHLQKT